jgi:hypothetical protein
VNTLVKEEKREAFPRRFKKSLKATITVVRNWKQSPISFVFRLRTEKIGEGSQTAFGDRAIEAKRV